MVAQSRMARWAAGSATADMALKHRARSVFRESGLLRSLPLTGLMLEVEAGTGHLVEAVMRRAQWRRCVALDASQTPSRRLAFRLRRRSLHAVRAAGHALPFGNARFDAAWSSFALHRLPQDGQDRVLAEMSRVTRPGGTLVLIVDTPANGRELGAARQEDQRLRWTKPGAYHYRTAQQWRTALPIHGWHIIEEVAFTAVFPRTTLRPVPHHSFICRRA